MNNSRLNNRILAFILSAASLLYFAMLTPARFGSYYDDGLYVAAAKALATGQGYRTISLPEEKRQTVIPPFYPFLLSFIWRVNPQFPANLIWMMLLSIVTMVAFLFLAYMYLLKNGYASRCQALIVLAFASINWRTMLLAGNIMSDMTYAALSIGALHLAEKMNRERYDRIIAVALGTIIGLAYLTRSSGITLLVAIVAYAILQRQWRRAVIPAAIASLFVLGWLGWVYLNRNGPESMNAVYYSNYVKGAFASISNLANVNDASAITTLLGILGTNILLLLVGSIPLACLGLRYDLPPAILVSFVLLTLILIAGGAIRQIRKGLRLSYIYLIAYLALHLIVPGTAYDRYLMPVVPILLLFLVVELSVPMRLVNKELIQGRQQTRKVTAAFIGLVLLVTIGGACYSNGSGIYDSLVSARQGKTRFDENSEAFEWIKGNTEGTDVVICRRDPVCYLYTDRKAVLSFPVVLLNTMPYQSRPLTFEEQANPFLEIINASKARYLLLNSDDFAYESTHYRDAIEMLIAGQKKRFIPVFRSSSGISTIYRIESDEQ